MLDYKAGITCHLVAFEVQDPEGTSTRKWIAKASAQFYDPHRTIAQLNEAATVLTGEVIRSVEGHSYAETEAAALVTALEGMLFQLEVLRRK